MKKITILAFITIILSSCASQKTLIEQYPAMYEEKPLTIAIMPPINQTTHTEAKDYFYTTMYMPLCEKGYYVFSPYLTMELFQQESAYDAEQFIDADLSIFQRILGADAAMFTIIKDWKRSNAGGALMVDIEYLLRSTKTGETLYTREGKILVQTTKNNQGLIATLIVTALTDMVVAGRKCNAVVLSNLPAGKYSSQYGRDANNPAGKTFIKAAVSK